MDDVDLAVTDSLAADMVAEEFQMAEALGRIEENSMVTETLA